MDGVTGDVSHFQMRTELYGDSSSAQIWVFRLERFDDEGNRLPPIPVEMRGLTAQGMISDGDKVEVHGSWREGVLVAQKARNLTTQSTVEFQGYNKRLGRLFLVLAILLVLGFLFIMGSALLNWR